MPAVIFIYVCDFFLSKMFFSWHFFFHFVYRRTKIMNNTEVLSVLMFVRLVFILFACALSRCIGKQFAYRKRTLIFNTMQTTKSVFFIPALPDTRFAFWLAWNTLDKSFLTGSYIKCNVRCTWNKFITWIKPTWISAQQARASHSPSNVFVVILCDVASWKEQMLWRRWKQKNSWTQPIELLDWNSLLLWV